MRWLLRSQLDFYNLKSRVRYHGLLCNVENEEASIK